MPIHLVTGLPGSGKSLGSVERMLAFKTKQPDRPVFVHGVDGLKENVAEPITAEQVKRWKELPVGSIVVVDEAQKLFPARRQGEPAQWVRDLSEHRHHGIDFVLATQHPSLLDNYVRTLVDRHTHHVRKFGGDTVDRYEWPDCCGSPTSKMERNRALRSKWRFPKKLFDLYKSAEAHTIKKRVPWKVYAMWIMAVVCVGGGLGAVWVLERSAHGARSRVAGVQASDASVSSQSERAADRPKYATPEDYAKAFIPRIAAQPWSAPAYDEQAVNAHPDILCVIFPSSTRKDDCRCYSEQVTPLTVPFGDCQNFATHGVYNPHRQPFADPARSMVSPASQDVSQGVPVLPGAVGADAPAGRAVGVGGSYDPSVFASRPHTESLGGS